MYIYICIYVYIYIYFLLISEFFPRITPENYNVSSLPSTMSSLIFFVNSETLVLFILIIIFLFRPLLIESVYGMVELYIY